MTISQADTQIELKTVHPATSPEWRELISSQPSTLFHSPQWIAVLEQTYGLTVNANLISRHGKPTAGIAWCQIEDFLGTRRVTLPYSDFCNPIASTPEETRTLAGMIAGGGFPWLLRSHAKHLPQLPFPEASSTLYKWHGIDLMADEETLWGRINSMSQRGVRKAERSGVRVWKAESLADLRQWYLLHLRLRKHKHGLLAQPYSFFEHIWHAFIANGQGFLMLVSEGDKIIAGTVYLLWQGTCYYKFNASDPDHLLTRPNNLLMWQGMREAKSMGCTLLDLGRTSAHQDGLLTYKRSFGSAEEDVRAVTYQPFSTAQEANPEAKKLLQSLTQLLVKETVPDEITEEAGAMLYRYFV